MKHSKLIAKTKAYIKAQGILKNVPVGGTLVLAVSGGPDSVALAHFMTEQFPGYSYLFAHFNHNLRPSAAEEARFVESFAAGRGGKFCLCSEDIQSYAASRGMGIEEAGRERRYIFFRSLGGDLILTAHHKDDLAESVLMHIIRGCGTGGLAGIRPLSGDLARPLLAVTKEEIRDYCAEYGLNYCTDETNEEPVCTRNRIRLELMPLLKQLNPSVTDSLARLSVLSSADEDYMNQSALAFYFEHSRHSEDGVILSLPHGSETALSRRAVKLAAKAVSVEVSSDRVDEILSLKQGKMLPISAKTAVYREKEGLCFCDVRKKAERNSFEQYVPFEGRMNLPGGLIAEFSTGPAKRGNPLSCASFPLSLFREERPALRNRRPGDYILLPDGHRKKLKDYLIDGKIPVSERDDLLLFAAGSRVLWLVGYRIFAKAEGECLNMILTAEKTDKK